MKKNLLYAALGVAVGLAIYHFAFKKKEKVQISSSLPSRTADHNYPIPSWVSYDIEHLGSQRQYIDELINRLGD